MPNTSHFLVLQLHILALLGLVVFVIFSMGSFTYFVGRTLRWPSRLDWQTYLLWLFNQMLILQTSVEECCEYVSKVLNQLTLRGEIFLSGPDLIRWILKRDRVLPNRGNSRVRKSQHGRNSLLLAWEMEGTLWQEMQEASSSWGQPLADGLQGNRDLTYYK